LEERPESAETFRELSLYSFSSTELIIALERNDPGAFA
jgi:hypothetical protein